MNYSQAVEALTGLMGYICPEPNIRINDTYLNYTSTYFNVRITEEDIFIINTTGNLAGNIAATTHSVIKVSPKQLEAILFLQTWLKQKLQTIRDEQERLKDTTTKYSVYVYDMWEDDRVCVYSSLYKDVLDFIKVIDGKLSFDVREDFTTNILISKKVAATSEKCSNQQAL